MIRDTLQSIAAVLGGRRTSRGWICHCPVPGHGRGQGDRDPSLSLTHTDDGRIVLHCFAGCDYPDILFELKRLGLVEQPVASVYQRHSNSDQAKGAGDGDLLYRSELARELWQSARLAPRSPVEAYLCKRGIALPIPPSLRIHPALKHHPSGTIWPAMVAAVQGPTGSIAAIHRTYLRRDGLGKAAVEPVKMALGPTAGGAVRLAEASDALQVAEGIETALAALQATARPTWAALSTSGIKALVLPDTVRYVTILADGDEPGVKAAQSAAERWHRQGRRVRIAVAPAGCDFADVLASRVTTPLTGAAA